MNFPALSLTYCWDPVHIPNMEVSTSDRVTSLPKKFLLFNFIRTFCYSFAILVAFSHLCSFLSIAYIPWAALFYSKVRESQNHLLGFLLPMGTYFTHPGTSAGKVFFKKRSDWSDNRVYFPGTLSLFIGSDA